MTQHRILSHRVVSNDGRVIAEAKSVSNNLDDSHFTAQQVMVSALANGNCDSSSSSISFSITKSVNSEPKTT